MCRRIFLNPFQDVKRYLILTKDYTLRVEKFKRSDSDGVTRYDQSVSDSFFFVSERQEMSKIVLNVLDISCLCVTELICC